MSPHATAANNPSWPSMTLDKRMENLAHTPPNTWGATGAHLIITALALESMRALRLQQWLIARRATKRLDDGRCSANTRADYQAEWSRAMSFVQALNELFPPGDTAENDECKASAARRGASVSVDRERLK